MVCAATRSFLSSWKRSCLLLCSAAFAHEAAGKVKWGPLTACAVLFRCILRTEDCTHPHGPMRLGNRAMYLICIYRICDHLVFVLFYFLLRLSDLPLQVVLSTQPDPFYLILPCPQSSFVMSFFGALSFCLAKIWAAVLRSARMPMRTGSVGVDGLWVGEGKTAIARKKMILHVCSRPARRGNDCHHVAGAEPLQSSHKKQVQGPPS